jgi:hypothetical protein
MVLVLTFEDTKKNNRIKQKKVQGKTWTFFDIYDCYSLKG